MDDVSTWGRRRLFESALAIGSGAVLAACAPGQQTGETGGTDRPAGGQAAGGQLSQATLRVGATFNPGTLDTAVDGNTALRVGLAEQLFRQGRDLKPVPQIASGGKQLDERTWEIGIRSGVKFSDGTPVDAAAVKASLERALDKSAQAKTLLRLDDIRLKDATTLQVVTQAPNLPLTAILTDSSTSIVSVKAAEQLGEAFANRPVMTGPYIVERHVTGQETVVVRNPSYWGSPGKLARMVFTGMTDNNSRVLALQAGDIDLAQTIAAASVPVIQADPRFLVKEATSLRVHKVFVNHAREAWQDVRVRQALAHAIDREALVKAGMSGGANAATGALPPSALACSGISGFAYDVAKARQLLAGAGYRDADGDGVVEKDGRPLLATMLTFKTRPELPVFAEIIQAQLRAIGIRASIRVVDDITAALNTGDWDIATSSTQTVQGGDPLAFFQNYMHSRGRLNSGKVASTRLDQVVDQAATAPGDRRAQLICDASKIATEEVAFVWLVYPKLYYGISKQVTGFEPHPNDFYFMDAMIGKSEK
jgi:peptide/nickel transport system substrate-binding protein